MREAVQQHGLLVAAHARALLGDELTVAALGEHRGEERLGVRAGAGSGRT